jgi:hypothetical protein
LKWGFIIPLSPPPPTSRPPALPRRPGNRQSSGSRQSSDILLPARPHHPLPSSFPSPHSSAVLITHRPSPSPNKRQNKKKKTERKMVN